MPTERPRPAQPIPPHAKKVFAGVIFDVYQWEQEMFDGTTKTFEKLKRPDTVVVIPILSDGKIILIEEEQPGKSMRTGMVSGRLEHAEDPQDGARRELREESGYEARSLTLWTACSPVSKIEWTIYFFIAKGITCVGNPELDGGEKITLKPVTFEELIEIASHPDFIEKDIRHFFTEATYDPKKREELRRLFDPTTL